MKNIGIMHLMILIYHWVTYKNHFPITPIYIKNHYNMQIIHLKDLDKVKDKALLKRLIIKGKKVNDNNILCECGSASYYLAPIVGARCYICNKPL